MTAAIELASLPAPEVIEPLDYQSILAAQLADVQRKASDLELTPADPVYKALEVTSYRELLLRARINSAARQTTLAGATGANLEHISALHGVRRLVVEEGDPAAIPPRPDVEEKDDSLRDRTQAAPRRLAAAGPIEAYRQHALAASGDVKDAGVDSPSPGKVRVVVHSHSAFPAPAETLQAVTDRLSDATVRPLTDQVEVVSATKLTVDIEAELTLDPGAPADAVLAAATVSVRTYMAGLERVNTAVPLAGLIAALWVPGVANVALTAPAADVDADKLKVPTLGDLTVTQA